MKKIILSNILLGAFIIGCNSAKEKTVETNQEAKTETIEAKVDNAFEQVQAATKAYNKVVSLDHHRMAAEEGVYTPPAIAYLFSDAEINTRLLEIDQLTGLDLPFKILAYAEPDTLSEKVAYTSAHFIQNRHGLNPSQLIEYKSAVDEVIYSFHEDLISRTNVDSVAKGYGIIMLKSDFDFGKTVSNLRAIVEGQNDTRWFGEIDYQKEASSLGVEIRPTMLLLFGGPAPGGKAMVSSPKIGLDAFCQKLLVYQNENDEVWVAYNDIVAFAELYYGQSTKPQQLINKRLKQTFTKAVTETLEQ